MTHAVAELPTDLTTPPQPDELNLTDTGPLPDASDGSPTTDLATEVTDYLAAQEVAANAAPAVTPFRFNQLDPASSRERSNRHHPIRYRDRMIISRAIDQSLGLKRHNQSRGLVGVSIASRGGALQSAAPSGERPAEACAVRFLLDDRQGIGVLANGLDSPVAAEAVAQGFHRALSRETFKKYDTPSRVQRRLRESAIATDDALGTAKEALGGAYDNARATMTGIKLLDGGRLAFTHAGENSLFIYGPDGTCQKHTEPDVKAGRDGTPALSAAYHGNDSPELRAEDQAGVIQLQPGRNIVVLASGSVIPRSLTSEQQAEGVGLLIRSLQLDMSDPEAATVLASHLVQRRVEHQTSAGALVFTIDVEPWKDRRVPWRRGTDFVRLSTLPLAVMAHSKLLSMQSGRQLYEEASGRGRAGRVLARSVDVVGGAAGALLLYWATRSVLAATGILHPPGQSGHSAEFVFPTPGGAGGQHDADAAAAAGDTLGSGGAVDPHPGTTGDGLPIPTTTPDFSQHQVALSTDPFSHRAANVSDWSKQSLAHYGTQAGLSDADIAALQRDHDVILGVNQAFYTDNPSTGHDLNHWLYSGTEYTRTGQNKAAYDQIMAWKAAHPDAATTPITPTPQPATPVPTPATTLPGAEATDRPAYDLPPVTQPAQEAKILGMSRGRAIATGAIGLLASVFSVGLVGLIRRRIRNRNADFEERRNGGIRSHRAGRQTGEHPTVPVDPQSAEESTPTVITPRPATPATPPTPAVPAKRPATPTTVVPAPAPPAEPFEPPTVGSGRRSRGGGSGRHTLNPALEEDSGGIPRTRRRAEAEASFFNDPFVDVT